MKPDLRGTLLDVYTLIDYWVREGLYGEAPTTLEPYVLELIKGAVGEPTLATREGFERRIQQVVERQCWTIKQTPSIVGKAIVGIRPNEDFWLGWIGWTSLDGWEKDGFDEGTFSSQSCNLTLKVEKGVELDGIPHLIDGRPCTWKGIRLTFTLHPKEVKTPVLDMDVPTILNKFDWTPNLTRSGVPCMVTRVGLSARDNHPFETEWVRHNSQTTSLSQQGWAVFSFTTPVEDDPMLINFWTREECVHFDGYLITLVAVPDTEGLGPNDILPLQYEQMDSTVKPEWDDDDFIGDETIYGERDGV